MLGFFISAAVIAYLAHRFLSIKVPKGYENKNVFRAVSLALKLVSKTAKFASSLGFGNQAVLYKKLFKPLEKAAKSHDETLRIENTRINNVPVRIYTPKGDEEMLPAVIFYHGGGYVFCSIETHDALTCMIAKRLNAVVISVDYRLAPENPYPIPMNDCWDVTEYILKNPREFKIDASRVALAGDSAGGAMVAIMTQRLVKERRTTPKLQVLIYPWMQHFDFSLPSHKEKFHKKITSTFDVSLHKYELWTLGIMDVPAKLEVALATNEHSLLIADEDLRRKYASYMDVDLIPEEYKKGRDYYSNYKKYSFAGASLSEDNILRKDKKLADLVKNLFNEDLSPGLVSDDVLRKQPKAYVVVCENDELKDETLIYAERLRRNGVDTRIAFYEDGYHGVMASLSKFYFNTIAVQMVDDLLRYLQENL